jgi:hypothetical protein
MSYIDGSKGYICIVRRLSTGINIAAFPERTSEITEIGYF